MPSLKGMDPQNERPPHGFASESACGRPARRTPRSTRPFSSRRHRGIPPLPPGVFTAGFWHTTYRGVSCWLRIPSQMLLNLKPENLFQCSL